MKKIIPVLLVLCFIMSVYADNYKILQMNTQTIKIGNRVCKKGDVFSDDSTIVWTKEKQAFKAQNIETKKIVLFTEPDFKAKNSMTIKDYYLKTNHLSTRDASLTLSELSELLDDTFYLLDTIRIESPIPLDSTRSYHVRYMQNEEVVESVLPSNNDRFMFVRSLFESCDSAANEEINVSVFFRSKSVDEDYVLTDSMKIVLLPMNFENY